MNQGIKRMGKPEPIEGFVGWDELLPTGKCFDDALDGLWAILKEEGPKAADSYRLAHGILHNPINGEVYSHAWFETPTTVFHSCVFRGSKGFAEIPKDHYYALLKITDVTLYTPKEAYEANHASGHYGPWIERYVELCKRPKTTT